MSQQVGVSGAFGVLLTPEWRAKLGEFDFNGLVDALADIELDEETPAPTEEDEELRDLRAAFALAGGRGVEMAERIDKLERQASPPTRDALLAEWSHRVRAAFAEMGVEVPSSARLCWTGSSDDRAGECETEPEQWVLGWGLYTRPRAYPAFGEEHDLFYEACLFHTWAWAG